MTAQDRPAEGLSTCCGNVGWHFTDCPAPPVSAAEARRCEGQGHATPYTVTGHEIHVGCTFGQDSPQVAGEDVERVAREAALDAMGARWWSDNSGEVEPWGELDADERANVIENAGLSPLADAALAALSARPVEAQGTDDGEVGRLREQARRLILARNEARAERDALRAAVEAAVVALNREVYQRPSARLDKIAAGLRAALSAVPGSGGQTPTVTAEGEEQWGVLVDDLSSADIWGDEAEAREWWQRAGGTLVRRRVTPWVPVDPARHDETEAGR